MAVSDQFPPLFGPILQGHFRSVPLRGAGPCSLSKMSSPVNWSYIPQGRQISLNWKPDGMA